MSPDPDRADRAKPDVSAGRAKDRIEGEELAMVLAELLDATGGPPTEAELTDASARLARGTPPW